GRGNPHHRRADARDLDDDHRAVRTIHRRSVPVSSRGAIRRGRTRLEGDPRIGGRAVVRPRATAPRRGRAGNPLLYAQPLDGDPRGLAQPAAFRSTVTGGPSIGTARAFVTGRG